MGNEYNGDKIVLRDTSGNQMSLARFFELALNDGNGHSTTPHRERQAVLTQITMRGICTAAV